jgi:hypothetical protein
MTIHIDRETATQRMERWAGGSIGVTRRSRISAG